VENVRLFGDFRATQQRRDYPEPFAVRVPAPRRKEEKPAALRSVEEV
jgi:hypothetical protein